MNRRDFLERVALEVDGSEDGEPRAVVVADEMAQEVVRAGRTTLARRLVGTPAVAVFEPLPQRHRPGRVVARPQPAGRWSRS